MASQEELDWWNRYAEVMERHWVLTPKLNEAIRSEYEREYRDYLFKPDGRLLEIGCGTGWIGRQFALRGMWVDGLDISSEQIRIAKDEAAKADLKNVAYFERDIVKADIRGRFETYDAVLVVAVLHHLAENEILSVLKKMVEVLAPGGKIYLYEPLQCRAGHGLKKFIFAPFDFCMRAFFALLGKAARLTDLYDDEFKTAMETGYTGTSPDEKPLDFEKAINCVTAAGLNISTIKPYHHYSIIFAMNIIRYKSGIFKLLEPLAGLFYKLDKFIFSVFGWSDIGARKMVLGSLYGEKRQPHAEA